MIKGVEVADVFAENTYFFIDEKTGEGFIIDPGANAGELLEIIKANNWKIRAILLTHGHFDHTGAVQELHDALGIPYYISRPGEAYLANPNLNLSATNGRYSVLNDAQYFNDGDIISLPDDPDFNLKVIATPGHTPDSVIFYSKKDNAAFVGDTLYFGGPGLTEFPGGDRATLMKSIYDKILTLPDSTILYTGHTPPISVANEKQLFYR